MFAKICFSTSKSNQDNRYSASQNNLLNVGGNINLTSTEGDIHLKNTQVNAKDTISLDSAKDILLESGQSTENADGKNSNMGASVGVGVSVGAQTGVYAYAEVGYGKGSNHVDATTHQNTTLNADQIKITSKGDTTLKAAIAMTNSIHCIKQEHFKVLDFINPFFDFFSNLFFLVCCIFRRVYSPRQKLINS
jgi:filamentous hemagglutinin